MTIYKLAKGDEIGLRFSERGLHYGDDDLVVRSPLSGLFEPVCGYGLFKLDQQSFASRLGGLRAIARFLNYGQTSTAYIAAAQLQLPILKGGFDPGEPRDDHGRWAGGGNDATAYQDTIISTPKHPGNYAVASTDDTETNAFIADGIKSVDDAKTIVEGMNGQFIGRNANCASLTRSLVPSLPPTSQWQRGDLVQNNPNIAIGTAIATFNYYDQPGTNGYGPADSIGGVAHMSHTGIYLGQDEKGLIILNQWTTSKGPTISKIDWDKWRTNINEGGSRYYVIKP